MFAKLQKRRNGNLGFLGGGGLGVVTRSVGYLQGGYKDGPKWSTVQLFNTNTQTGRIVYDTGYAQSYIPGITGNLSGYFYANGIQFSKYNYVSASASASFNLAKLPIVSSFDLTKLTTAWAPCSNIAGINGWGDDAEWVKIDLTTDTPVSYGNLVGVTGSTRQGISTSTGGLFVGGKDGDILVRMIYATVTPIVERGYDGQGSCVCGMSITDTSAKFITTNVEYNYTLSGGAMPIAKANTALFTYQFAESHSLVSDTAGYMMAGFADTTGRFGMTQHGLCQKIVLATSAIVTMADLVTPQSSGQMMQGF